jgi:hypothetical protein
MQIGFVAGAFLLAAPFAYGAYNRHAAEVRAIAEASAPPRKRKAAPTQE